MKRIVIVLLFLAGTLGFTNAGAQQKTIPKKPAATKTAPVKANDTTVVKKPGMKKDGTPDMRLKANKNLKTAPAGPLKADSTPDMRYKANKAKAKSK
jgi:hypothetical protein